MRVVAVIVGIFAGVVAAVVAALVVCGAWLLTGSSAVATVGVFVLIPVLGICAGIYVASLMLQSGSRPVPPDRMDHE